MVKNKIQPRGKQNLCGLPLRGEVAVAGGKKKKKNIYIYIYIYVYIYMMGSSESRCQRVLKFGLISLKLLLCFLIIPHCTLILINADHMTPLNHSFFLR